VKRPSPTRRGFGAFPGLLAAAASTLLSAGCATIYARGLVRDAGGSPVGNAVVRVTSDETARPIAVSKTDANGCFSVSELAPRHRRGFTIEAAAPGFEPAAFRFTLHSPILLATLAGASADARSEIRSMSPKERSTLWEPLCVPAIPREASSLSPD